MIDQVQMRLEIDSGNDAVVSNPMGALADMIQSQVVDRMRAGADYGSLRDANGNTVGSWNIFIDGEAPDQYEVY